jgi:hypothetical protein
MKACRLIAPLGVAVLGLGLSLAAHGMTVTHCSTDVDTSSIRTSLAEAIQAGGQIRFSCPAGTVMKVTGRYQVPAGTHIDGGGRVTLDAQGLAGPIFRSSGSLSISHIRFVGGRASASQLGRRRASLIQGMGTVLLQDVDVESSDFAVEVDGTAYVTASRFSKNSLPLSVRGMAFIVRSVFSENTGSVAVSGGEVRDSRFERNTTALRVSTSNGVVRVSRTTFLDNRPRGAILLSQRSAHGADGELLVTRSTFVRNFHEAGGGAITTFDPAAIAPNDETRQAVRRLPRARLAVRYSHFEANSGAHAGAIHADLSAMHGLEVIGGIFLANESFAGGGALHWHDGPARIRHSVFTGNVAAASGAAILGTRDVAPMASQVANSLFAENKSAGAAVDVDWAQMAQVTVARNIGSGLKAGPRSSLSNSILVGNERSNCREVSAASLGGGNLQFGDESCPNMQVADPQLDAMYAPIIGSPALHAGRVADCRSELVGGVDLVFQGRALGGTCASGAFERFPLRALMPKPEVRTPVEDRFTTEPEHEDH